MGDPNHDPHQVPEEEAEARAEVIVRRALAELRAIDPGCDCIVLHATRVLLSLALDDRVFLKADAFAALDLVRYLELVQSYRRDRFGLDRVTTDGPVDFRAGAAGRLVEVRVRVGIRMADVATALKALDPDDAPESGGASA